MRTVDSNLIVKARRYANYYYRKHKNDREHEGRHPSHLANEAIKKAGEKYDIGYGTEGFCLDEGGREGITYLNMGDTYEWTVFFDTRFERFYTSCYGDVIERLEKEGITIK